jgi:hypothetical protein
MTPAILKYKSFTVSHDMKAEFITTDKALPYILKGFAAMRPFCEFLNLALVV